MPHGSVLCLAKFTIVDVIVSTTCRSPARYLQTQSMACHDCLVPHRAMGLIKWVVCMSATQDGGRQHIYVCNLEAAAASTFYSPPRFIIRSRNVCGVLRQSVAAQFDTTAGSAVVTSDLVLCAVHVHCSKLPSLHSVNTICCKLM